MIMLEYIVETTNAFLDQMPKSQRKKKGQFFTSSETAVFMANMFDLSSINSVIKMLDPGTGTGILAAALIERLNQENKVKRIELTCYETDIDVLPILKENLKYIAEKVKKEFSYTIIEEDYILSQQDTFNETFFAEKNPVKYDLVIGNPPYIRVMRDNPAALAMPAVVHGAPNLYFLFASMSLFNLKQESEMVYIVPRSWTSGAYFTAFRQYLLGEGRLEQIHLFVSRDKVFSEEQVLQETMIIRVKKTVNIPSHVLITSSKSNDDFNDITKLDVPYASVVTGSSLYVYLPTSEADIRVLDMINTYRYTFPDEGLRMRTGIVVDFRQWEDLRKEPGEHHLPLFYSQHIRGGKVNHNPSGKEYDWIIDSKRGLIQKNKNYVFCKRFTAKEERRRLQCGIYNPKEFEQYSFIATQNKINYVDRVDGEEMDIDTTYGVYALLNSTLFDMYYRILNGSTQVNSTEINSIPVPPMNIIDHIGDRLRDSGDLSTRNCDRIIMEVAYA